MYYSVSVKPIQTVQTLKLNNFKTVQALQNMKYEVTKWQMLVHFSTVFISLGIS